jgi:AcrR family transcriptional regulator
MKKTSSLNKRKYGGIQGNLRKKLRRERLMDAGLEAFGTTGYAKTSIKKICQLAGLTERYFYESFRNKEDLLYSVYRALTDDMKSKAVAIMANQNDLPEKVAYDAAKMYFQNFKDDPRKARIQLFEVLGVSQKIAREYQRAMRILARMLKLYLFNMFPDNRKKLDDDIVITGLAGALTQIAYRWVQEDFVTPIDEVVTQYMEVITTIGKHL